MDNIQLKDRTIEPAYGQNVDTAPALLARYEKGEGVISSEADIRLLGVRNFKNAPQLARNYWDTSTLSATKGETVKIILPYETGNRTLTDAARFGLGLINSDESLVDYGVNLDIDGRWEKLEGSGVYTKQRDEWFKKRKKLESSESYLSRPMVEWFDHLVGCNSDMTEEQAMECPLLLTKLGHPDYVDKEFWRVSGEKNKSGDEVAEIIGETFRLGKQGYSGFDTMMGQYSEEPTHDGILRGWYVDRLDQWSRSKETILVNCSGRFAFDTKSNAKSGLKTLEGMSTTA